MSRLTEHLESIAERIRLNLAAMDGAREKIFHQCREAIRYCSNAIRAVHRHEFDHAEELLQSARNLLDQAEQSMGKDGEFGTGGLIRDARKEFAEGHITLALATGQLPPTPEQLGVDYAAYLNGMGEAVGELRRFLLDNMRSGDLSHGEEILSDMDDIYNVLVTMDFPDAITGGLRRTTDIVRSVLEKTRSDLTIAIREKNLEKKLEKLEKSQ